ncbi:MAG: hypothetical protein CMK59_11250 [Proteobacteria bacterium]|nr:hypothetical protein [Pseudomonadota bacterium]
MLFALLGCKGQIDSPLPQGWISGDVPDRPAPPSGEVQNMIFGGFFSEFFNIENSSFSNGVGGFIVVSLDEQNEESILCSYHHDLTFTDAANDCESCSFAFDFYEEAPSQTGDESYCAHFGIGLNDVGAQEGSFGFNDGEAFQRNSSGDWVSVGTAEYAQDTQTLSYYNIIGYID